MTYSSDRIDACVIGSGAGGGVVAKELGEQGVNVIVLEGGRRFNPLQDYVAARPDWEIVSPESLKQFAVPALAEMTLGNKASYRPHEVHGVGGGTLLYVAYAVRFRPDDFRIYSIDGVGQDWPITYEDLVPYYRKVELELGVSGDADDPWTPMIKPYPNPPFDFSYANKIVKRGFDRLGIKLWPAAMARLSKPFDGRPMCVQCGKCNLGCMSGAKSSIDVTYIKKAEATGKVIVKPQCVATRIEVDARGLAKSVVYFDQDGSEHELEADIIIASCGTVQSPRLLLNSKSSAFPDGLANTSGLVGKYFMQHTGSRSIAVFPDRIESFRGFPGGAISQDHCQTNPKKSFVRGYRYDLLSGFGGPVRLSSMLSSWGKQGKKEMMEIFGHTAGLMTLGEQLPIETNAIDLDPVKKDPYGMPVPRVNIEWYSNEKAMIAEMNKDIKEIFDAAGATRIIPLGDSRPGDGVHNIGTCRMGRDPKFSVLNSFCQSHDVPNLFVVDGSCFVTGGTANPSLTIHALAVRAAEFITKEAKKGNLWIGRS